MSNIQQVELSIEHARQGVKFGEALDRLMKNRDFQKVILDGYLRDEAVRLVHLKADPGMYTADDQGALDAQIITVGLFGAWLRRQRKEAETAQKELADNQDLLEVLREEEAEAQA